jgi:hypothetical protein
MPPPAQPQPPSGAAQWQTAATAQRPKRKGSFANQGAKKKPKQNRNGNKHFQYLQQRNREGTDKHFKRQFNKKGREQKQTAPRSAPKTHPRAPLRDGSFPRNNERTPATLPGFEGTAEPQWTAGTQQLDGNAQQLADTLDLQYFSSVGGEEAAGGPLLLHAASDHEEDPDDDDDDTSSETDAHAAPDAPNAAPDVQEDSPDSEERSLEWQVRNLAADNAKLRTKVQQLMMLQEENEHLRERCQQLENYLGKHGEDSPEASGDVRAAVVGNSDDDVAMHSDGGDNPA